MRPPASRVEAIGSERAEAAPEPTRGLNSESTVC